MKIETKTADIIGCNHRTAEEIEEIVVMERLHLYNQGEPCGPKALVRRLDEESVRPLPSASTVARILVRNCLTNGRTGYYPEDES